MGYQSWAGIPGEPWTDTRRKIWPNCVGRFASLPHHHHSTALPTGPAHHSKMDGADLPSPSAAAADRRPETAGDGGGGEGEVAASPPERCEALAAAIAGVLGGALREHEERAAATARSQDEVAAAVDRLNGGGWNHFLSPSHLPRDTPSYSQLARFCCSCCHVAGVPWLRVLKLHSIFLPH